MKAEKINVYPNVYSKTPETMAIDMALGAYTQDPYYLKKVERVREEKDKEKQGQMKIKLPCFIPQQFTELIGGKEVKKRTKIIVLDCDYVPEDRLNFVKKEVEEQIGNHCYLISKSTSGKGLHCWVLIESSKDRKNAYVVLSKIVYRYCSFIDPSFFKNLKQKITITTDENAFVNLNPNPFRLPEEMLDYKHADDYFTLMEVLENLKNQGFWFIENGRHEFVKKLVGICLNKNLDQDFVFDELKWIIGIDQFPKHAKTFLDMYEQYQGKQESKKKDKAWDIEAIYKFIKSRYKIRFNQLTCDYYQNDRRLTDEDYNTIYTDLHLAGASISRSSIKYLVENNHANMYHPVKDFVKDHETLNTNNELKKLAATLKTSSYSDVDFNFIEEVISLFMVGMINQVFNDKPNEILISLLGNQGVGKTWWFRYLLPEALRSYYTEHPFENTKDFKILMSKKILILDDELAGKRKIEMDALKRLLSANYQDIRVPYGLIAVPRKLVASFAGTGNSDDILRDPTGNRRIIPIWLDSIDQELYNSIDKNVLFLEAYKLWQSGHPYQLEKRHLEALKTIQSEFEFKSSEEEFLLRYFEPVPDDRLDDKDVQWKPTSEILQDLVMVYGEKLNLYHLGTALKKHSFQSKYRKVGNSKLRCFALWRREKPTPPQENVDITRLLSGDLDDQNTDEG